MAGLLRERGLANYHFAVVATYRSDPSLNGLSIPDAARKVLRADDLESQLEMMRRMLRAGGASMVYQFMAEDDIGRILRHPHVAIASDSGAQRDGRRRAASPRLRQQCAGARPLRSRASRRPAGGGRSQDDLPACRSLGFRNEDVSRLARPPTSWSSTRRASSIVRPTRSPTLRARHPVRARQRRASHPQRARYGRQGGRGAGEGEKLGRARHSYCGKSFHRRARRASGHIALHPRPSALSAICACINRYG